MPDDVEILKHISNVHRSLFDQRRQYEWKTVTATLSLYVLAVGARLSGRPGALAVPGWAVWTFSIVFAVLISTYLRFLHQANNRNKKFAHAAEAILITKSNAEPLKVLQEEAQAWKRFNWSLWGQVVVIFAFAGAAAALFSS